MGQHLNPLHSSCICCECEVSRRNANEYAEKLTAFIPAFLVAAGIKCPLSMRQEMIVRILHVIGTAEYCGRTPYQLFTELSELFALSVPPGVSAQELQLLLTRRYSEGNQGDGIR